MAQSNSDPSQKLERSEVEVPASKSGIRMGSALF